MRPPQLARKKGVAAGQAVQPRREVGWYRPVADPCGTAQCLLRRQTPQLDLLGDRLPDEVGKHRLPPVRPLGADRPVCRNNEQAFVSQFPQDVAQ